MAFTLNQQKDFELTNISGNGFDNSFSLQKPLNETEKAEFRQETAESQRLQIVLQNKFQ